MSTSSRANRGKIAKLTRDLTIEWQHTQERWRDGKSRDFDQKFMAPLPDAVNSAVAVMDQLDKLLTKIRNDCE